MASQCLKKVSFFTIWILLWPFLAFQKFKDWEKWVIFGGKWDIFFVILKHYKGHKNLVHSYSMPRYLWLWKVMGRSRTSKSLQCGVCGDNASVHKHYGSQAHVCFSCRAFFRRVNKVKKYPESTLCNSFLTQVGSCPITKRTRAFCR